MFDIIATGNGWIAILAVCFIVGAFLTGLIFKAIGSILKILLVIAGIAVGLALLYLLFKKLFGKSAPSCSENKNSSNSEE